MSRDLKPVVWIASSRRDLADFPDLIRDKVGFALYLAQRGGKSDAAKSLRGFGDATVLEIVADHREGTYRAVYTVRFADTIYVLHAFQKKSKSGIATPKPDMELIRQRLQAAAYLAAQARQERTTTP